MRHGEAAPAEKGARGDGFDSSALAPHLAAQGALRHRIVRCGRIGRSRGRFRRRPGVDLERPVRVRAGRRRGAFGLGLAGRRGRAGPCGRRPETIRGHTRPSSQRPPTARSRTPSTSPTSQESFRSPPPPPREPQARRSPSPLRLRPPPAPTGTPTLDSDEEEYDARRDGHPDRHRTGRQVTPSTIAVDDDADDAWDHSADVTVAAGRDDHRHLRSSR